MGMAAIFVMWPASYHQIFISLYLKAFIQNLVQIGKVVSEKIRFEFLHVHDLGPRIRNDLDLQYSHTFIHSNRCLLLPTFRSLAAIISEKFTVFTFSYRKDYVTKFDLAVNRSRLLQGHHLNNLWWAGPWCYIPSFMKICLPVLEKIFEGFIPYMGVAAILVMWPASCPQIFIPLYLKACIQNRFQIGTEVSEKIRFEFLYVHDLGPRSSNDLDLQYSHNLIYSITCLLLPTFKSLVAIFLKNPLFSLFPIEKPMLPNLTLP